jgi:hypothetical protein
MLNILELHRSFFLVFKRQVQSGSGFRAKKKRQVRGLRFEAKNIRHSGFKAFQIRNEEYGFQVKSQIILELNFPALYLR